MAQTRRYAARQINLAIAGDDHSGIFSRRVRNIFICTEVAFCASSSITYAFDRVRPP